MARTKIDRRILKTKRAIICALLKLQKAGDFDRITVTALTNTADINRKTFYLHYKSVEDVGIQFESQLANRVEELLQASLSQKTGISPETLFRKFQDHIDQYQDVFRALFVPAILPVYLNHIQSRLVVAFENALRESHSCSEAELHNRVVFCMSGVVSMYLDWSCNAGSQSLSALTESLTRLAILSFEGIRKE